MIEFAWLFPLQSVMLSLNPSVGVITDNKCWKKINYKCQLFVLVSHEKKNSTYVVQSRKYFVGATKERWQLIWQKSHRILSAQKGKFDILLHLGLLPIGQTFGHIVSAMLRPWWHFNYVEAWKWKEMTYYHFIGPD